MNPAVTNGHAEAKPGKRKKGNGSEMVMACPKCAGRHSRIYDKRLCGADDHIQRYRECIACGHKFATVEVLRSSFDAYGKIEEIVQSLSAPDKRV